MIEVVRRLLNPGLTVLRLARHTPDRLLHQARRARLLRRLRDAGMPHSVLFVCLGNINRSPYAAAAFKRAVAGRGGAAIRVRSAGFIGPGRPSPEAARSAAAARGLNLAPHKSRLLDLAELQETALVVVMDQRQLRNVRAMVASAGTEVIMLGDLDPHPIRTRTVRDPYGQADDVFETVFDRIDRCIDALARAVTARTGSHPTA